MTAPSSPKIRSPASPTALSGRAPKGLEIAPASPFSPSKLKVRTFSPVYLQDTHFVWAAVYLRMKIHIFVWAAVYLRMKIHLFVWAGPCIFA